MSDRQSETPPNEFATDDLYPGSGPVAKLDLAETHLEGAPLRLHVAAISEQPCPV